MSKSSIYEVASLAGVSIATVSRTLNQPHRVSESTRTRVMDAVHKLEYTPDYEAAARARHHKDRIAVLTPFNTYPGSTQRLRGISLALEELQSELIIFQVDAEKMRNPQHSKLVESLASSGRYDGVIVMNLPLDHQEMHRISETYFPTVLIETSDPRFISLCIDNRHGASLAVNHLLERGYKKIGFVGFNALHGYADNASKEREQGYIEALLNKGFQVNPNHIVYCEYNIESARSEVEKLLMREDRPDALFCAADINALGVLKAANTCNLRVPEDIGVVGFDDMEFAEYLELSTIRQPLEGSGKEAALMISRLLKEPRNVKPQEIFLPLELIVRKSS